MGGATKLYVTYLPNRLNDGKQFEEDIGAGSVIWTIGGTRAGLRNEVQD